MATATAAQVLALIAPALAARSDSGDYLALSIRQHAPASKIGAMYPDLIAYHCAHRMTATLGEIAAQVNAQPSTPGAVTSLGAGDLSIGYASRTGGRQTVSAADEEYVTTRYGTMYLSIRDGLVITASRVVAADPMAGTVP